VLSVVEEEFSEDNENKLVVGEHAGQRTRRKLIRELTKMSAGKPGDMLQFVQRTSLETYATVDRIREILKGGFHKPDGDYDFTGGNFRHVQDGLNYELSLVAAMINADLGAQVYYVSIDGFDTHGEQKQTHADLLAKVSSSIANFFSELQGDRAKSVALMTFSEFGRRVSENGSMGTDHGAASNMFVVGPGVAGGVVGKHPSLDPGKLSGGDLAHHTDFRQVYATLLDRWLGCDSRRVLGGTFDHVKLFG
jgi:uncharacterized protein (DUF1501 family)